MRMLTLAINTYFNCHLIAYKLRCFSRFILSKGAGSSDMARNMSPLFTSMANFVQITGAHDKTIGSIFNMSVAFTSLSPGLNEFISTPTALKLIKEKMGDVVVIMEAPCGSEFSSELFFNQTGTEFPFQCMMGFPPILSHKLNRICML